MWAYEVEDKYILNICLACRSPFFMNELQSFTHNELGQVRTVTREVESNSII